MRARRFRPHALQVAAVLLCLVLVTSHYSMGVFARYTASDSAGDAARVAAFVFNVTPSSHAFDLSGIQKPGDSQSYSFTVKSGSEVSVNCNLKMTLNGSLPLMATLKDGETTLGTLNLLNDHAADSAIEADNNAYTFTPNVSTGKTYNLTVTWPETENDLKYASDSAAGSVVVTVLGTQID